jgi:fermentation-respiration switch protein FrsA (DUF1100 family)
MADPVHHPRGGPPREDHRLRKIACPIFVIRITRNEIIPFWYGETLYRQARKPKMNLWVEGADHNNPAMIAISPLTISPDL